MSKKSSVSEKFTSRDDEGTHARLSIHISDNKIYFDFVTPDDEGYIELHVPLSRRQMDKYLNPWVFDEMIERLLPVEVGWMGFNRRVDLEEDERRFRAEERKTSKRRKGK